MLKCIANLHYTNNIVDV